MSSHPITDPDRVSTPAPFRAPRALSADEIVVARAVADALIPATAGNLNATADPDFDTCLSRAVDARADAFESLTASLAALADLESALLFSALRDLHDSDVEAFDVLSAVTAEAWLLAPSVRQHIGYPGQQRSPIPISEAADQLEDLLDGVMERGSFYVPTPTESADGDTIPWAQLHPDFSEK